MVRLLSEDLLVIFFSNKLLEYFFVNEKKEEGAKVAIVDVLKLEGEKLASELNLKIGNN